MTVIPSDDVLLSAALVTGRLEILDHVLVGILLGVHSGLSSLDGKAKGVGDDDGVAVSVALHQTHDFDGATGTSVHDHFYESNGADANVFEVVGIFPPRLGLVGGLLVIGGVVVEGIANGINKLYAIVEFCCRKLVLASYLSIYLGR